MCFKNGNVSGNVTITTTTTSGSSITTNTSISSDGIASGGGDGGSNYCFSCCCGSVHDSFGNTLASNCSRQPGYGSYTQQCFCQGFV